MAFPVLLIEIMTSFVVHLVPLASWQQGCVICAKDLDGLDASDEYPLSHPSR
ncbi:hypothetical protein M378DRAFT_171102 [Amanita muscaria Koide BX008]|uniref:Uncharacterized protein n=1 Tax=Amanita muscaria (strain Koide BX008) TaxID=946122 RepID=A0A0C2S5P8_AMAMK|nr:hypothetical protein M378DRAFT_171875 [Amanita muscaria Koide BX008]KIL58050.1 hypothetical protein M378DRAFT_171102 [Amanita muscaria Koide BX008]